MANGMGWNHAQANVVAFSAFLCPLAVAHGSADRRALGPKLSQSKPILSRTATRNQKIKIQHMPTLVIVRRRCASISSAPRLILIPGTQWPMSHCSIYILIPWNKSSLRLNSIRGLINRKFHLNYNSEAKGNRQHASAFSHPILPTMQKTVKTGTKNK